MQHVKLMDVVTLTTTNTSYVANGSGDKTYIKGFLAHNSGTVNSELSVYNVPDSGGSLGTPSSSNRIFNILIEPAVTIDISFEYPLTLSDTNDSIFASASVATTINFQLKGGKA